jgi:hypothetical protein
LKSVSGGNTEVGSRLELHSGLLVHGANHRILDGILGRSPSTHPFFEPWIDMEGVYRVCMEFIVYHIFEAFAKAYADRIMIFGRAPQEFWARNEMKQKNDLVQHDQEIDLRNCQEREIYQVHYETGHQPLLPPCCFPNHPSQNQCKS